METESHNLPVRKSARICTLGETDSPNSPLWIVLHGYGQLAPYFIKHFQVLADKGHGVVAPEGLNRFYLEGTGGRVGATWMTKEERLQDIDDYVAYLNKVGDQFQLADSNRPVYVLGFSQGASTAVRWCGYGNVNPDALILWAGSFPPDLDWEVAFNKISSIPMHYVYGKEDPYLEHFKVEEVAQKLRDKGLDPTVHTFRGKHSIDSEMLEKLHSNFLQVS